MPKSKSRSSKRRARRRTAHTRSAQDRHEQVFETSLADFERMLTAQDRQLLAEAMDAEQHGELGDALACLQSTLRPTGNSWESGLTEMVELGDAAQAWHWTRFTVAAAGRWIARLPVPLVARVQREIAEAAEGVEGPLIPVYPGWVAGLSAVQPAVTGYLLFDELMLEVFLVQIAPWLAEQAGGGRTWAEVQGRVYELLDVDGGELSVRDHASGEQKTVRHSGEAMGLGFGGLVYGHLVEIPAEPGLVFAAPPIVVDELAAQKLMRSGSDDEAWFFEALDTRCATLGAAVRSGGRHIQSLEAWDDEPAPSP